MGSRLMKLAGEGVFLVLESTCSSTGSSNEWPKQAAALSQSRQCRSVSMLLGKLSSIFFIPSKAE